MADLTTVAVIGTTVAAVANSAAVNSLVNRICDLIGTSRLPTHTRDMAEAKAAEVALLTQAKAKATVDEAKADNKALELTAAAFQRVAREAVREQQNIDAVHDLAVLLFDPNVDPDGISDEFLYDVFDRAKKANDAKAREMWAKVLAGEANAPGSYSKKTLGVLSDMDRQHAERFQLLCGTVWDFGGELRPIMLKKSKHELYYESLGLTESLIQSLSEVGLVQFSPAGFVGLAGLPKGLRVSYFSRVFENREDNDTGPRSRLRLTRAGRELFQLSGARPFDGFPEYLLTEWPIRLRERFTG